MSKKSTTSDEAPKKAGGRKIILPNGEARVDYIRRRFYEDGITRGDIARELSEMTGEKVAYQIVFAATKEKKEGETCGEAA